MLGFLFPAFPSKGGKMERYMLYLGGKMFAQQKHYCI